MILKPLEFIGVPDGNDERYKIALLDNRIKIHFLHYKSEEEVERKWISRIARLLTNDNDLYIKICDRDGFNQTHLDAFESLPFINKVGFFKRGRFDISKHQWAIEVDTPFKTVESGVELWQRVRQDGLFDAASWVQANANDKLAKGGGVG